MKTVLDRNLYGKVSYTINQLVLGNLYLNRMSISLSNVYLFYVCIS